MSASLYLRDHERIFRDPAASDWLKEAVRASIARDPVDALNDVEVLQGLCQARLELVQDQDRRLSESDD